MPWRRIEPMEERKQFINLAMDRVINMKDLCSVFEISRKTGYKWLARYKENGIKGLEELSKAPKKPPNKTGEDVVEFILETRRRHPKWGPRTITYHAKKKARHLGLPSETTIQNIIRRAGLSKKKRRRHKAKHPGRPSIVSTRPNELWTVDFKGEFKTRDGYYCYPLTIQDEYSRFMIACTAMYNTQHGGVFKAFKKAFKEYGLPEYIKSDNGAPFATVGLGRVSRLSIWLIRLGIQPILIEPGRPSQNGKHERMHRTLKDEATIPPSGNLQAQQRRFNTWLQEYNYERPHDSLAGKYPSEVYEPSSRSFPSKLPEVEYPDHFEVRYVSKNHCFRWKCRAIIVCPALIGHYIGLEEINEGIWAVYYSWNRIGFLVEGKNRVLDNL
jgi:putative transposase